MGQAYAPPDKYLNPSPLPSSPDQTLNQTLNPSNEPYSSTPLTEPYSSNPSTELHSSTLPTEPYSSTPLTEPNSSNNLTLNNHNEPYSSNPPTEPYSSTNCTSKVNTHNQINYSTSSEEWLYLGRWSPIPSILRPHNGGKKKVCGSTVIEKIPYGNSS